MAHEQPPMWITTAPATTMSDNDRNLMHLANCRNLMHDDE